MNWLDDMEAADPAYGRQDLAAEIAAAVETNRRLLRGSTPVGDAAREATASPYIGRHRSDPRRCTDCGHQEDLCGCPHTCTYGDTNA